jgi:hypothetical protein
MVSLSDCAPRPSLHFVFEVEDAQGTLLGWTKLYVFGMAGLSAGENEKAIILMIIIAIIIIIIIIIILII